MTDGQIKKRGRPAGSVNGPKKEKDTRNLTLHSELLEKVKAVQDRLSAQMGFGLTLSQTLHYMINNFSEAQK